MKDKKCIHSLHHIILHTVHGTTVFSMFCLLQYCNRLLVLFQRYSSPSNEISVSIYSPLWYSEPYLKKQKLAISCECVRLLNH